MKPNPGRCPPEAAGKRVYVLLRNGRDNREPVSATAFLGWAADGRNGCSWRQTGSPADIMEYEVIK